MSKKMLPVFMTLAIILTSCLAERPQQNYQRHQSEFWELFDTHTSVIAYTTSEEEFNNYLSIVRDTMARLHKLYDIYNNYDGLNNIKTINDNAGIAPVEVEDEIIDLILFGKSAYEETGGVVNIALGPVLRLWHDARSRTGNHYLPAMSELRAAAENTDISNVIVDEEFRTVFLENEGMSLDVGAIAKGYSVMRAIEAAKEAGLTSGIVNSGGNVVTVGRPMDHRARWGVGVHEPKPDASGERTLIDIIYTNDISVVTSGNYQRFFTLDGKNYNHIIDPHSLMPAERFSAVTILHPHSGIAEILSTTLFILPIEEGAALLSEFGADALWIMPDGSMEATEGFKAISRNYSNYSGVD